MSDEIRHHVAEEFLKVRPRLSVYALSLTRDSDRADDLLQDVFLRCVENASGFEAGTNFAAWSFRIMRNHFLDGLRRPKNRPHVDIADVVITQRPAQEDNIQTRHLIRYLRLLPKDTRRILLMAGLEGMSYEQIAALTGFEVGTIKSKVSRTRALLDGAL